MSDQHRAVACVELSNCLLSRFQIYHETEDIQESVNLAHEACQLIPAQLENVYFCRASARLGRALIWRYYHVSGRYEDLDQAISYLREFFNTVVSKTVHEWETLCDLGWALCLHYKDISQDQATLAEAHECHRKALLPLGPDHHSQRSIIIFRLLQDSLAKFVVNRDMSSHDEAMDLFWQLMANQCLAAQYRFDFCSDIVRDFQHSLPVTSILDICHCALSLLPQLAYLGLEINSRRVLLQAAQLAALAAKSALSVGKATEAVVVIELGRAIFWSKALQLRISHNNIPGGLGQEFFELSRMLEGYSRLNSHSGSDAASEEQLSRHRGMANKYEQLLEQIRNIPGHEDFLRPHSFQKLCSAAQEGFIVMLSPAETGYNAIIFGSTSDVPTIVHLPDVTTERLVVLSSRFNREIERARDAQQFNTLTIAGDLLADRLQMTKRRERESTVETLLAELWRTAVHPVIEALQIPVSVVAHRSPN